MRFTRLYRCPVPMVLVLLALDAASAAPARVTRTVPIARGEHRLQVVWILPPMACGLYIRFRRSQVGRVLGATDVERGNRDDRPD